MKYTVANPYKYLPNNVATEELSFDCTRLDLSIIVSKTGHSLD